MAYRPRQRTVPVMQQELIVRPMREDDIDAFGELQLLPQIAETAGDSLLHFEIRGTNGRADFVLEHDGILVGYVSAVPATLEESHDSSLSIIEMAVHPDWPSDTVATLLIATIDSLRPLRAMALQEADLLSE